MNNQELSRQAHDTRREILKLQEKLKAAQSKLTQLEAQCRHDWTDPVYDPIITPGYHVDEYRQGVHFTPAMDVPEQRKPRWRRHCRCCGKTEVTEHSHEKVHKQDVPIFPSDRR